MQFLQLHLITIIIVSILVPLVDAQLVSIDNDFRVASGEEPGSCDKVKQDLALQGLDLNSFYVEAFDMAEEIGFRLLDYSSNQVLRATLQTVFGIRQDSTKNPVQIMLEDEGLYNFVETTFSTIADFPNLESGAPNLDSIFCDTSWLQLTSIRYDTKTGLPTGETISELMNGLTAEMYWSPLHKQYLSNNRIPCDTDMLAITTPPGMAAITLCPFMFSNPSSQSKPTLKPYRSPKPVPPNQPLQEFMSWSGTFLHEMTHYLLPGVIKDQPVTTFVNGVPTEVIAYGVNRCVRLARASPNIAIKNADSYRWFATAMYLNQLDWSRSYGALPLQVAVPSTTSSSTTVA